MHRIHQTQNKGKVLIATENLSPGVDLFCEKALFSVDTIDSPEDLKELSYLVEQTGIDIVLWIGFTKFRAQLQPVDQLKIFELYGPTDGARAEEYRTKLKDYVDKHDGWTEFEIEQFVQYCMVASQNAFASNNEDYHTDLFETASRMSHSCQPNCCVFLHTNNRCTVRTISPVQVGHELTISYNSGFDGRQTHERRTSYLRAKDFQCDCPRCSAPGDDTRQFDCIFKSCNGRHYACQPTSKAAPYLLPCVVCNRVASKGYQVEMFALEKRFPQMAQQMTTLCEELDRCFTTHSVQELIKKAIAIYKLLPKYHRRSFSVLCQYKTFYVKSYSKIKFNSTYEAAYRTPKFLEIIRAKVRIFDHIKLSPNVFVAGVFDSAVADVLLTDSKITLEFLGLKWAKQALRIHLLHFGRSGPDRIVEHQETLIRVMKELSEETHIADPPRTECAFCGENPDRAAITLERCKKCKKVVYCTQHCMEAHWDFHVKSCIVK